ncbi:MAG: hypothetical protein ACYTGO_14580 [Planctomycetota bacterium]|jgi:hypothetical protein
MNVLNKTCMVLAFGLGALLLILGALGLVFGCNAHFTLPPVLGALPAAVGWGIVWAVRRAWGGGTVASSPQAGREQYGLR